MYVWLTKVDNATLVWRWNAILNTKNSRKTFKNFEHLYDWKSKQLLTSFRHFTPASIKATLALNSYSYPFDMPNRICNFCSSSCTIGPNCESPGFPTLKVNRPWFLINNFSTKSISWLIHLTYYFETGMHINSATFAKFKLSLIGLTLA